jgi:hypothetical protein
MQLLLSRPWLLLLQYDDVLLNNTKCENEILLLLFRK